MKPPPPWKDVEDVIAFINNILDQEEWDELQRGAQLEGWDGAQEIRRAIHDFNIRQLEKADEDNPTFSSVEKAAEFYAAEMSRERVRRLGSRYKFGRPPKEPGERESISLLPDAEKYCITIMELIDRHYPQVPRTKTEPFARKIAIRRIYEFLGDKALTVKKLSIFMKQPHGDRRRFGQRRPPREPKKKPNLR
jgi:hypothetical protein